MTQRKTISETPWSLSSLVCDDSLASQTISDMCPQIIQKMILQKLNSIKYDCIIYTDVFKTEDIVGCAFNTLEVTKNSKVVRLVPPFFKNHSQMMKNSKTLRKIHL